MNSIQRGMLAFARTGLGEWLLKNVMEPLDPFVYKWTRGTFTAAGPALLPQLVLTTKGRKSGKLRSVQLLYVEVDDAVHVVASNFGGEKHPAWSYNLEADPKAKIQLGARTYDATAERLTEAEKEKIWPALVDEVPNYGKYRLRTDRHIRVYRIVE